MGFILARIEHGVYRPTGAAGLFWGRVYTSGILATLERRSI